MQYTIATTAAVMNQQPTHLTTTMGYPQHIPTTNPIRDDIRHQREKQGGYTTWTLHHAPPTNVPAVHTTPSTPAKGEAPQAAFPTRPPYSANVQFAVNAVMPQPVLPQPPTQPHP